jgi:hypothetical protein
MGFSRLDTNAILFPLLMLLVGVGGLVGLGEAWLGKHKETRKQHKHFNWNQK